MDKLFKNLDKYKKNIALINMDGEKYTYNDILKFSKKINSKIKKKSIILLIVSNNTESIKGYISFIRSENLSIILDKSFKTEFAEKIIHKYKPEYIYTPKNFLKDIFSQEIVFNGIDYVLYRTIYKKKIKINKKNLILLTTSGTTQNPKLVRISNLNITENTKRISDYLQINSKHTTITTMPMGYSFGLSIINTHLHKGSKILVNEKTVFDKIFWENIKRYKITSFGGVPNFYEILKKLRFENFYLPTLKYLTQAGGKLNIETLKYFEKICRKKKLKFFVMYGQTEASPRMSYLNFNKLSENLGSIGKPLKNTLFRLVDDKKKFITKPNVVGEIVFYGKNVCLGYANNINDFSKGDINKSRLFTGDLGYKNTKGYYYITGRKNRFAKIFGVRVNLDDIEHCLRKENYNIKCLNDDNSLKILVEKNYNFENIKNITYKNFCIRPNSINIQKVESFIERKSYKN